MDRGPGRTKANGIVQEFVDDQFRSVSKFLAKTGQQGRIGDHSPHVRNIAAIGRKNYAQGFGKIHGRKYTLI